MVGVQSFLLPIYLTYTVYSHNLGQIFNIIQASHICLMAPSQRSPASETEDCFLENAAGQGSFGSQGGAGGPHALDIRARML